MTAVAGWDATGSNLHLAPATGQGATYVTGSGGIAATPAQLAARPGIITIDQDRAGSRADACIIDDEPGADTDTGSATWYKRALAEYEAGINPGQKHPAIYRDESGLATLGPAVQAAGLAEPVYLWLALWGLSEAEAAAMTGTRRGPFLIIAVQYANRGNYDADVWDSAWLASGGKPAPPPPPNWQENMMRQLPTLRQGAKGDDVRSIQALCVARGHGALLGAYQVDGDFGPATANAVRAVQSAAGVTTDPAGVVGPATWQALLAV